MTDRELVTVFVTTGSHEAFDELFRRHIDMVYGVCRRVLGDAHVADDAAQAAFLVLFKKAPRIPSDVAVSGWLHRVAENCARNAHRVAANRVRHEQESRTMHAAFSKPEAPWEEVRPVLDEALAALPSAQRDALVLRYLRGLSQAETAREMNCPEETIHTRVTRGLAALRSRLGKRELELSPLSLVVCLERKCITQAPATFSASVHAACTGTTGATTGAMALAKGAMLTMLWTSTKTVGAMAVIALLAAASFHVFTSTPPRPPSVAEKTPPLTSTPVASEKNAPVSPSAAETIRPVSKPLDRVLNDSLAWMASAQEADGRFDCAKHGGKAGLDVATTSVAVLSWLGAGNTGIAGQYQAQVRNAMDWLRDQNPADTVQKAFRAAAFAELAGVTADVTDYARELFQKALSDLIQAQGPDGSWVDNGKSGLRPLNVTAVAVLALTSARLAKLDVPQEPLNRTISYLQKQQTAVLLSQDGDLAWQLASCWAFMGRKANDPELTALAPLLAVHPPVWDDAVGVEAFNWWQGTVAAFQMGRPSWSKWADPLQQVLSQHQSDNGSWKTSSTFALGQVGTAALNMLTAEIISRYGVSPGSGHPNAGGAPAQKPSDF